MYGRISGMGTFPLRVALALRTPPRSGFPHRAGRYGPGESPLSSLAWTVVDVWKDF